MKAYEHITNILVACGCKPTTTATNAGTVTIKVNAPNPNERNASNEKTKD